MASFIQRLAVLPLLFLFDSVPNANAVPPRGANSERVSPKLHLSVRGGQNHPSPVQAGHPPILVTGFITYLDHNDQVRPVRDAHIEIWDDDGSSILNPDDYLGDTSTDMDGRYLHFVDNDEDNGVDLYIKVFSISPAAWVTSDSWFLPRESIYQFSSGSPLVDWLETDARIDVAVPPDSNAAFEVFDLVVEAWQRVKDTLGVELRDLPVEYPSSSALAPTGASYNPVLGFMFVVDGFNSRFVISHEYGHFLAWERGFADGGFSASHDFCTDWRDFTSYESTAQAGAMSEGWADFFAAWIDRVSGQGPWCDGCEGSDCDFWCEHFEQFELIEFCKSYDPVQNHDGHGEFFETPITATLWDMYDPHLTADCCEPVPIRDSITENVERPIGEIMATLDNNDIKTIEEFYYHYLRAKQPQHEHRDLRRAVTDIFLDNGMGFPAERPHDPFPGDGAIGVPATISLSWLSESGDRFDLLFSRDPEVTYEDDFIGNTIEDTTIWEPGQLLACTDYSWQVIAGNSLGLDSWGPIWHFRTGPNSVRISGHVTTSNGAPLVGVTVRFDPGASATTDGTGLFSRHFQCRWSGTVIPEKPGWSFVPASRAFSELISDQQADFVGTCPYPSIDSQPTSASICTGETHEFCVVASATGTLSYQWERNQADIPGTTSACFTTWNAGSYRCRITNSCGSVTSSSATLIVNEPPSIITQPAGATICTGERHQLCVAAAGTAPLRYDWWLFWEGFGWLPIPFEHSPCMSVPSFLLTAGEYRCAVSNACGLLYSDAANLTIDPGSPCDTEGDCDDGAFCNGVETCNENGCCEPGADSCLPRQDCDEDEDLCLPCPADFDCDGIEDAEDNCSCGFNPEQCDSDSDGIGNLCDADVTNDGIVDLSDFEAFRLSFGKKSGDQGHNAACDFDCDGVVGVPDFNILRQFFGSVPGGNECLETYRKTNGKPSGGREGSR